MKSIDIKDLYFDGAIYDLLTAKIAPDDVPFHLAMAKKYGGPMLELACGTGRVTIPLAKSGADVTGLDMSAPMLEVARTKAAAAVAKIDFVEGDMRDFDLGKKFELIVITYNSIHHLHELGDFEACMRSVKDHLADGGRFVVDLHNPNLNLLIRDPERRLPFFSFQSEDGSTQIEIAESASYDPATQIQKIVWYYRIGDRADARIVRWNMRIYFPLELDALFEYNGFEIEHKYGDYDLSKFRSESPKMMYVLKTKR